MSKKRPVEREKTKPAGRKKSAQKADAIARIIVQAEEVIDPLDGLIERTKDDPGAPFEDDIIKEIVELKKTNWPKFEVLRNGLKEAGCRMTGFDQALKAKGGGPAREPTQADILIELAKAAKLFRDAEGHAYADVQVDGHRETWPVKGKDFRSWLGLIFFNETNNAANSEAMKSALNTLEAKAIYEAPEQEVFIRVAGAGGNLYIDLCDRSWRAVEVAKNGWAIVDKPPVRFRRTPGMKEMAAPVSGGHIDTLRDFLNVKSDTDFVLVVAWMIAVMRNRGPYPIIALAGEQGSAKSTFSKVLRALLDPNFAPLRAIPNDEQDMFISAQNSHVLAFDNVSNISTSVSDVLCRLATGGGFATRQLYSDSAETIFHASRPIILNGIEDIVSRSDLADRTIFLHLSAIREQDRRSDTELWSEFETKQPEIFGVLLDCLVEGLRMQSHTTFEKLPRMADFAIWAKSCETAIWETGTFEKAYEKNRSAAIERVIESNAVAKTVCELMTERTRWTGTATLLLEELENIAGERVIRSKQWPKSAERLSGQLQRVSTDLRAVGIEVDRKREGNNRTRLIIITKIST